MSKKNSWSKNKYTSRGDVMFSNTDEGFMDEHLLGDMIVKDKFNQPVHPKTQGQMNLITTISTHDVVFANGPAGTGKTLLATAYALKMLKEKSINKIILTRPPIECGKGMGFLPGDLNEKIEPYLRPFLSALDKLVRPDELKRLLDAKAIEIYPIGFMRGDTLDDCFVILDEAQNCTSEEIKMFLTRLGVNGKYVITGDVSQNDLRGSSVSGLSRAREILFGIQGIKIEDLTIDDVVRHRLVKEIIQAYDNNGG